MEFNDLGNNAYRIEMNRDTGGPVARVVVDGKPTTAFVCLIAPIDRDEQPYFLTDQQWQEAKDMLAAADQKPF